ncbi:hypothetical protein [Aliiroseovarius sp. F20344]|uniref:hypothetical protein n=1 Tax=Aliiroseovarius sp. F20344 TaxID=2926414 RepID=UPI001FF33BBF|nr:hypothetical protein [Aliiroseovarius sp. F20344]MCK0142582.1 hypothetical protein [Aliiroseovarius sp. F20344]
MKTTLLTTIYLLTMSVAYGDALGNPPPYHTKGVVSSVNDDGSFEFAGDPQLYRLWGITPNEGFVDEFRKLVTGNWIGCYERQSSRSLTSAEVANPQPVDCMRVKSYYRTGMYWIKGISSTWLYTGKAAPYCPEAIELWWVADCSKHVCCN